MHTIFKTDCVELMKNIPDKSIDAIITDPPYYFKKDKKYYRINSWGTNPQDIGVKGDYENYMDFLNKIFKEFKRVLKEKGNLIIFHSYKMIPSLLISSFKNGFEIHRYLIWIKKHVPTNDNSITPATEFITIFKHPKDKPYFDPSVKKYMSEKKLYNFHISEKAGGPESSGNLLFSSVKPPDILRVLVVGFCPPGGIILDPFLGTGSIIPVANSVGRYVIGSEIDDIAFDLCKHRLIEMGGEYNVKE